MNVFANQSALRMLKIKKETILNKSIKEAFPKIDQTKLPLFYAALMETGQAQQIPLFAYGDEKIQPAHFRVDLVLLHSGYIGVFFEDISKQVTAQKLLHEKVKEAERLNEFMVGREIKMMELKKELEKFNKKPQIKNKKK